MQRHLSLQFSSRNKKFLCVQGILKVIYIHSRNLVLNKHQWFFHVLAAQCFSSPLLYPKDLIPTNDCIQDWTTWHNVMKIKVTMLTDFEKLVRIGGRGYRIKTLKAEYEQ